MKSIFINAITASILFLLPNVNFGQTPDLGTASGFALFTAVGAFSNIGAATIVTGDVGTNVGAFSAFPPGTLIGQEHVVDPVSVTAATDVDVAYMYLDQLTCDSVIGVTLGNSQVLPPHVYCIGAATSLNADLILDGKGDPNALFIFEIDGALSTSTHANVVLINSASLCNVYWQVNGAFSLGDSSVFRGTLLVNGAINLLEGSSLLGRGLSRSGAIGLHNNIVTLGAQPVAPVISSSAATVVCAGDTVSYAINNFNLSFTYDWVLQGGGTIIDNTDSTITVVWQTQPGGPFTISVTVTGGCASATATFNVFIHGTGPLACIDNINLSIDNECGTVVNSGMILTGELAGDTSYTVVIMDLAGHIIPGNMFTWEDVGKTFKVSVQNRCNGQSCWSYITVEDKLAPIINCICPPDNDSRFCTITCRDVEQILAGNIPEQLRPEVIDNCGGNTLTIINTVLDFNYCVNGTIQITWEATDKSGNSSTCLQVFRIVPLTLQTLTFPLDYIGVCHGSSDPSVTGYPQVDGIDLDLPAGVCNLSVTYKDLLIQLCGNGTKVIRTWTVRDWCTG
ncbi:MAG: ice-binding family protein, partial [Saprospiraceae bacterium]